MDRYAALLAITAVWHGLAMWHFLFFPGRTIARYTAERPVHRIAQEILRFLGGLNAAIAALALGALAGWPGRHPALFAFFALANASQLAQDLAVHRAGLTNARFIRDITIGDGVVALLNAAAAVALTGL